MLVLDMVSSRTLKRSWCTRSAWPWLPKSPSPVTACCGCAIVASLRPYPHERGRRGAEGVERVVHGCRRVRGRSVRWLGGVQRRMSSIFVCAPLASRGRCRCQHGERVARGPGRRRHGTPSARLDEVGGVAQIVAAGCRPSGCKARAAERCEAAAQSLPLGGREGRANEVSGSTVARHCSRRHQGAERVDQLVNRVTAFRSRRRRLKPDEARQGDFSIPAAELGPCQRCGQGHGGAGAATRGGQRSVRMDRTNHVPYRSSRRSPAGWLLLRRCPRWA